MYDAPNRNPMKICSSLISKPVNVILQSIPWEGPLKSDRTVCATLAGLDHHHILGEDFPVVTAEQYRQRFGLLWAAAPSIQA